MLIPLLGGRLIGGSLNLFARQFPESRLRLDQIGALFGESGFGPISQIITGGMEGLLFGSCIAGALAIARSGSEHGSREILGLVNHEIAIDRLRPEGFSHWEGALSL